ncbi:midnolin homolog [Ostrinia nubilalis]|uniref:midnolin homolog n=1 Tax=Ostrinia nubilalis TaxID=29057 RepID=UPI003082393E
MERATGTEVYGCGSPQTSDITLNIQTTTGGNFSISLNDKNTVDHLKKLVSKKLRVAKDRICLLHRERQLTDGTLEENGVLDGSRIILLPSVETGLLSQRPENSVMQALESLNDTQVNDFLSGKSPLNLTMRLGDHMMLIQLQLSTLNSSSSNSARPLRPKFPVPIARPKCEPRETPSPQSTPQKPSSSNESTEESDKPKRITIIQKQDLEMLQNFLYRSMADNVDKAESSDDKDESMDTTNGTLSDISSTSIDNEQSPIKSLSNLVSSPIDASTSESKADAALVNSVKSNLIDLLSQSKLNSEVIPSTSAISDQPCPSTSSLTQDSSASDDSDNFADQSSFLAESTIDEYPMENLFNSAIDKGLFEEQDESMMDREISNLATTSHGAQETTAGTLPSFQSINEPLKNKRFQYLLHKTSKFKHPIGQNKQKAFMQSVVNKHKKRMQIKQDSNLAQPSTSRTDPYITNSRKLILQPSSGQAADDATPSTSKQQVPFKAPDAPKKPQRASPTPLVDTKALIEASKNLTQKLKKLSKEVLTNKIDLRSAEEVVRQKIGPGAVIESMKHHGKGIYSGTFSGTLNPALQDRYGRPKRDISTIIHILNDLLCATPPLALAQKEQKHSCASTSSAAEQPRACGACACADSCHKCDSAKALALDNSKTKGKLEQLRLVMQQKKQRREARKLGRPYAPPPPPKPERDEIDTLA